MWCLLNDFSCTPNQYHPSDRPHSSFELPQTSTTNLTSSSKLLSSPCGRFIGLSTSQAIDIYPTDAFLRSNFSSTLRFNSKWGSFVHPQWTEAFNQPLIISTFTSLSPAVVVYSPLKRKEIAILTLPSISSDFPLLLCSCSSPFLIALLSRSRSLFIFDPTKSSKPIITINLVQYCRQRFCTRSLAQLRQMFFSPCKTLLILLFLISF
ncbi:hypothetical protein GEMRC1_002551 [Eukaryota sp. GEM-RC1]